MAVVDLVPLLFAFFVLLSLGFAPLVPVLDDIVTRISMALFGSYINEVGRRRTVRRARLRAGHIPKTFRVYASRTLFFAAVMALIGAVLGLYFISGALIVLKIDPATLRDTLPRTVWFLAGFVGIEEISLVQFFGLVLLSGMTFGVVSGALTYYLRWWYPGYVADERERQIDTGLPRTVAFIYALSRSGMAFPEVMRILANNRHIYGEAADEVGVAVRNMELFGMDIITAIKRMARRTPSEQFKEFCQNLVSVLQSGRSLSEFLSREYDEFREEARAQQETMLDLLATLAEVYVTVLVAGPLFIITILVVIGIAVGNTLVPLRAITYILLPTANVAFMIYLTTLTDKLQQADVIKDEAVSGRDHLAGVRSASETALADGGRDTESSSTLERLAAYRRIRGLQRTIGNPMRTVIERPTMLLWVTVPLALLLIGVRLPEAFASSGVTITPDLSISVRVLDDIIVQALLFVVGTFAIAYEVHRRRIEGIEAAVPDFLDRMASVNEAGMTVVESIDRVRGSELGTLDTEIDRVWSDIQWGADIETALKRFERRVRTTTISRIVTLTTKAMNASGDLATVLRIAAKQAKSDRRLKRERRQEMIAYLVVVYISFLVFLFIIITLEEFLIPRLPQGDTIPNDSTTTAATASGPLNNIGSINTDAYSLIFFHVATIQGAVSGFVAGQLSKGDIRAGAKHAALLVTVSYVTFLVFV
ncbi:type II secretion protein F [Halobacteriales archaeon SW_7_68_16]|nr:MAG: type II secretion protein F [Halobacteriales archaeon SW_7_68_16]